MFEKHFLGIEVIQKTNDGLELNRSRYAMNILPKYKILNCKSYRSPILPTSKLNKSEDTPLKDVTSHRA